MLLRKRVHVRGLFKILLLLPWIVPVVVSSTAWNWLVATPGSPVPVIASHLGLGRYCSWPIPRPRSRLLVQGLAELPVHDAHGERRPGRGGQRHLRGGAGRRGHGWQQLRRITLPVIARSTYISWILMFIFCIGDFQSIYLLTGGGPVNATTTLVVLVLPDRLQQLPDRPRGGHRLHDDHRLGGRGPRAFPSDKAGEGILSTSTALVTTVAAPETGRRRGRKKEKLNATSPRFATVLVFDLRGRADTCRCHGRALGAAAAREHEPCLGDVAELQLYLQPDPVLVWLRNSLEVTLSWCWCRSRWPLPPGTSCRVAAARRSAPTPCCCSSPRRSPSSSRPSRCSCSSPRSTWTTA